MKQLTKTNQKERKNKGITLIALVITIIVLLILAAVSISTLTGDNGILTKANEAKEMTEIAKIKEEVQTEILAVQAENDGKITTTQLKIILDKYFSNVPNDNQLNEEIELITTEGNYKIKLSDIFKGSLSEGNGNTEDLAINRLKINSSAPTEAERSPYVNYNGRTCRVLYDNSSSYGLQIIPTKSVGTVPLGTGDTTVSASDFKYTSSDGADVMDANFKKAAASYNKAVDTLNNKAKEYMDKQGISNKARCLGSSAKFENDTEEMYATSSIWSQWRGLFKEGDEKCDNDVKQLENLGIKIETSNSYVWLASRSVYNDTSNLGFYVDVIPRKSDTLGEVIFDAFSAHGLCHPGINYDGTIFYYSNDPEYDFYPVFAISDNAKIIGGEGTAENPYVLGL